MNSLATVDCAAQSSTKIRIGTWSLTREDVAKILSDKARRCDSVEIVVNRMSSQACHTLTSTTQPHNLTIRTFSRKEKGKDNPHGIHEKNMMIGGNYDGDNGSRVVFTSSGNLNTLSLRKNDENMIRVLNNKTVYDQFIDHFDNELMPAAEVEVGSGDCDKVVVGKH